MTRDDDPPELRGYVPRDDDKPLRHPMTMLVFRVAVVLGVIGLVVPGLYATVTLQERSAVRSCAATVATVAPGNESIARFELAGPEGPSWYCYTRDFGGHELLVRALGLIPG
jgi:hypothetical protein